MCVYSFQKKVKGDSKEIRQERKLPFKELVRSLPVVTVYGQSQTISEKLSSMFSDQGLF